MANGNVTDIYTAATGHAPDKAGLEYWTGRQRAGEDISKSIAGAINPTNISQWDTGAVKAYDPIVDVKQNYQDLYQKTGDTVGEDYWTKDVSSGRLLPSELKQSMATAGGPPTQTVTTPGMVDKHAKMAAMIPGYFEKLMGGVDKFETAYQNLADLPGQIDEWTDESLKSQRMTGDMSTAMLNRIATQRAGGGVMGGTEAENLEANEAARLNAIILENQNKIRQQANALKAGTIQGIPGMALTPVSQGLNLYGTSAGEAANWGQMAMNTLLGGY